MNSARQALTAGMLRKRMSSYTASSSMHLWILSLSRSSDSESTTQDGSLSPPG